MKIANWYGRMTEHDFVVPPRNDEVNSCAGYFEQVDKHGNSLMIYCAKQKDNLIHTNSSLRKENHSLRKENRPNA